MYYLSDRGTTIAKQHSPLISLRRTVGAKDPRKETYYFRQRESKSNPRSAIGLPYRCVGNREQPL